MVDLNFSSEQANAFIDDPDAWQLRPIRFLSYDEKLYKTLCRRAT